jgi:hypothetical protein
MSIDEIAKELAVACLSHDKFAMHFEPQSHSKLDAQDAGVRVGAFYASLYKTVLGAFSASSESTTT